MVKNPINIVDGKLEISSFGARELALVVEKPTTEVSPFNSELSG
ncbi:MULTISPECIES: hypothetical protein [Moorena]|nr:MULTISPECIES: hypothetical protein [Moorena]